MNTFAAKAVKAAQTITVAMASTVAKAIAGVKAIALGAICLALGLAYGPLNAQNEAQPVQQNDRTQAVVPSPKSITKVQDEDKNGHSAVEKFRPKAQKDDLLDRVQWRITTWSSGNAYNNQDLRELDISSDGAIDQTDDKVLFALTGFELALYFTITHDLAFNLQLWMTDFWGDDELAGDVGNNNHASDNAAGPNLINIGCEFNAELFFVRSQTFHFRTKIGRQGFSIGGFNKDCAAAEMGLQQRSLYGGGFQRDYILHDALDAITLQVAHRYVGSFDILAFDYFWSGSKTSHVNSVGTQSSHSGKVDNFDGDVNTIRYGVVYTTPNLLNFGRRAFHNKNELWARLKAYGFYADYGAGHEGGADRTNLGTTGNFSDNDYVGLTGGRFLLNSAFAAIYAGGAISSGVDRKAPSFGGSTRDVALNGSAAEAGVELRPMGLLTLKKALGAFGKFFRLRLGGDFFTASGPKYNREGRLINHGFVGFKGNQVGGLVLDQYYGQHPSAYTAHHGIDNFAHDPDRKSGSRVFHVFIELTFWEKLHVGGDVWVLKDTGTSAIQNFVNRPHFAQRRLGKNLGQEFDAHIRYEYNQYLDFYVVAGVFIPGRFYETVGLRSSAPQGNTAATGFQGGLVLRF